MSGTVLIVDDDEGMRDTLNAILRRDYRVLRAASGEAALAILNREDVDLMLLDVRLPGIDGFDVLRIVKENYSLVEVIMISAMPDGSIESQALAHGAIAFLPKPFFFADVSRAVHGALGLKMPSLTANWSPDRHLKRHVDVCPADASEDDEVDSVDSKDRAVAWT